MDMSKFTGAFCGNANAPENLLVSNSSQKKRKPTAASGRIRKLNEVASRVKRHAVAFVTTLKVC
jgi:hypothetical protein